MISERKKTMVREVRDAKLIGDNFVAINQVVLIELDCFAGRDKYGKQSTYRDGKYFVEGRVVTLTDTFLSLDTSVQFFAQSISISYNEIKNIEIIG